MDRIPIDPVLLNWSGVRVSVWLVCHFGDIIYIVGDVIHFFDDIVPIESLSMILCISLKELKP